MRQWTSPKVVATHNEREILWPEIPVAWADGPNTFFFESFMLEHPQDPLAAEALPFTGLLGRFRGIVPTTEELIQERRAEVMREDERIS